MNAKNFLISFRSEICEKFFEEIEKQCHILYLLNDDDLFLFFDNVFASEFNAKITRLIEDAQIVQNFQKINVKDFLDIESARATLSQFWH